MNARNPKYPARLRGVGLCASAEQLWLDFNRQCAHSPGHPRRLAGRAAACVRCVDCGVVLERLGVCALVAAGLELGALTLDGGRP